MEGIKPFQLFVEPDTVSRDDPKSELFFRTRLHCRWKVPFTVDGEDMVQLCYTDNCLAKKWYLDITVHPSLGCLALTMADISEGDAYKLLAAITKVRWMLAEKGGLSFSEAKPGIRGLIQALK